jgi:hypothetical protein
MLNNVVTLSKTMSKAANKKKRKASSSSSNLASQVNVKAQVSQPSYVALLSVKSSLLLELGGLIRRLEKGTKDITLSSKISNKTTFSKTVERLPQAFVPGLAAESNVALTPVYHTTQLTRA